jgi:S1-C subfamily serine protease
MLKHALLGPFIALVLIGSASAADFDLNEVFQGVTRLSAQVPPDARSARTLGTEREGNGVVIDDSGLVLTIGYLILEAMAVTVHDKDGKPVGADPIAYDYDTGFGLVRASRPLGVKPIPIGDSARVAVKDPVLVVGHGGMSGSLPALVVSKRVFAGYWEYLLDEAIFTAPPHANWGGTALVDRQGKLIGIGSLTVGEAAGGERGVPGNMFVPINLLKPILADLLSEGRATGPRPAWLGMYSSEALGRVVIAQVTPGGPAEKAGIKAGDIVVGVAGKEIEDLPGFYRRIRGLGEAGVTVPLQVLRGTEVLTVPVQSVDRYKFLRLGRTY